MTQKASKTVPMEEMSPLISELINSGTDVTITVTGNSMKPMLWHLRDTVLLTKCDPASLKKGDIPLYKRESGHYILHRILKVNKDSYDIAGDHQYILERDVKKTQVLCVVKGFTRNGRYHSVNEVGYRIYSFIWRLLFPFRKLIMKIHGKLHRLFCRKK